MLQVQLQKRQQKSNLHIGDPVKPIWRWTVGGNINELGWEVFSESVRLGPKVYPEFDFIICHNNTTSEQEERLKYLSIPLLRQQEHMSCVPHGETDVCTDFAWKIIPPRLRPESHELWVDNDVVVRDRIPAIDAWLERDVSVISMGFDSLYGRFQDRISVDCCAGFFGLPPHFNFEERIISLCEGKPLEGFDEQGLVTYIVSNIPNWILIRYNDFRMWGHWQKEFGAELPSGIHFVGANRNEFLTSWNYYKVVSQP